MHCNAYTHGFELHGPVLTLMTVSKMLARMVALVSTALANTLALVLKDLLAAIVPILPAVHQTLPA